jgi:4-amino-4-deoxychorismate lyase
LNRLGQVTEGTISNLFFIKGSKLKTPHLELNILPGITRNKIINIAKELKIEVQEGFFSEEDVVEADSVFFTNSLIKKGLMWVCELEGRELKKNEIVHNIENKYFKIHNTMV